MSDQSQSPPDDNPLVTLTITIPKATLDEVEAAQALWLATWGRQAAGEFDLTSSRPEAVRTRRAARRLTNEVLAALAAARQAVAAPAPGPPTGTMGLWRMHGIAGGKYLVQRRDGSVPAWPYFVLGARDPAAPGALRAYAHICIGRTDPAYVADVQRLANEFDVYHRVHGSGDPDATPHRVDDPATVAKMAKGKGA